MVRVFLAIKKGDQLEVQTFHGVRTEATGMFRFTPNVHFGVMRQTYHEHRPILRCRSHDYFFPKCTRQSLLKL